MPVEPEHVQPKMALDGQMFGPFSFLITKAEILDVDYLNNNQLPRLFIEFRVQNQFVRTPAIRDEHLPVIWRQGVQLKCVDPRASIVPILYRSIEGKDVEFPLAQGRKSLSKFADEGSMEFVMPRILDKLKGDPIHLQINYIKLNGWTMTRFFDTFKKISELLKPPKGDEFEFTIDSSPIHVMQNILRSDHFNLEALKPLDCSQIDGESFVCLLDHTIATLLPSEQAYTRCYYMLRKFSADHGMLPRSYYLDLSSSRLDADLKIFVANGGGGTVYKGTFARKEVALKAVTAAHSDNKTSEIAPAFIKEVILWKCIRHPNILPFLGVYQPDRRLDNRYIVSPWMENGEISRYLKCNPKVDRVKLIIDIVHGIKYLHSPDVNVVHGDLKPSNILVDEEGRACLADFGLSRMKIALSSVSITSSPTAYTVRYAAPERVFFYEYDLLSTDLLKESDVFSLAMVMWQIFTDEVPFPKCKYSPAVSALIKSGKRPERLAEKTLERGLSDPIWDIMERCWSGVLEERPSLDEVLKRLPVRGTPRRK